MKNAFFLLPGALMLTGTAFAQDAVPAQQPPAADAPMSAQQAAPVSQDEVDRFALAALVIGQIAADESLDQQQQQSAMMATVQEVGLHPQRFNQIAEASETDEALQQKIELAAAQHIEAAQQQNQ